jgi:hypothetical protein
MSGGGAEGRTAGEATVRRGSRNDSPIDRRVLLGVLAGCACCTVARPLPAAAQSWTRDPEIKGCKVPDRLVARFVENGLTLGNTASAKKSGSAGDALVRTTGRADLDRAFDAALYRLAQTFSIFPGFGFFDDEPDATNAFAMGKSIIPGTDGTVAFGHHHFKKWLTFDPSGVAVIATAAHEWAHVWMFRSGRFDALLAGQPTVKRAELHADAMAGFYLGLRKKDNPNASLWAAGDKFRQIGDYETRQRDHHGTPAERVAAAEAGFKMSYVEGRSPAQAFDAAYAYVIRL